MPKNPVDIYVGTKLRIRRSELGMSQNKIGELTGITFQQVQKYEKGVNRIGSSRLYELSKILRVPISYFFEGYESHKNSGVYLEEFRGKDSPDEREIIKMIDKFSCLKSPELRKSVFEFIGNLVKLM